MSPSNTIPVAYARPLEQDDEESGSLPVGQAIELTDRVSPQAIELTGVAPRRNTDSEEGQYGHAHDALSPSRENVRPPQINAIGNYRFITTRGGRRVMVQRRRAAVQPSDGPLCSPVQCLLFWLVVLFCFFLAVFTSTDNGPNNNNNTKTPKSLFVYKYDITDLGYPSPQGQMYYLYSSMNAVFDGQCEDRCKYADAYAFFDYNYHEGRLFQNDYRVSCICYSPSIKTSSECLCPADRLIDASRVTLHSKTLLDMDNYTVTVADGNCCGGF